MTTTFNIRDYGAVGDGETNDAVAIQTAIDACTAHGGGTVLVPAGATFVSGSVVLKSNVDLHVERGATLRASGKWEDITERLAVSPLAMNPVRGYEITPDTPVGGQFITARDASNIAITGAGTIDGSGRLYVLEDLGDIYRMPVTRPFTVFFIDCRDVTLRETRYSDGALWTIRLTGCENVLVHALRIFSDMKMPNADGVALDRCRDVRVSDCVMVCADDCIVLKTCEEFPGSGPCENITITNCVLESRSTAVLLGSQAAAPIRNVVVENCVIRASHRGLSLKPSQGGVYENILFSNIIIETQLHGNSWWGSAEPINVSVMPWHDEAGYIRNVRFVNILARGEGGVYVNSVGPGHIDGILFDNVRVEIDKWTDVPGGHRDRRPYRDPDAKEDLPLAAFSISNASNVTIRNCEAVWGARRQPYFGAALETSDVDRLIIEGFVGEPAFPEKSAAIVHRRTTIVSGVASR